MKDSDLLPSQIVSSLDYSNPRYDWIDNDEDIANLPVLNHEYSVKFAQFICGNETVWANGIIRVRPGRQKASWVEFYGNTHDRKKRVLICRVGQLTLDQMKLVARRIVELSYTEGRPPKKRIRLSRSMQLHEAWVQFCDLERVSDGHNNSRQAVMKRHILPKFGRAPVAHLTKREARDLLETLFLAEPGQARTLLKHLKRFSSWCVQQGLIDVNPLQQFKLLVPTTHATRMDINELMQIIAAASEMGEPWNSIVALSIATTECIEDIRQMKGCDIDVCGGDWRKSHMGEFDQDDVSKFNTGFLNAYALEVIKDLIHVSGYLFRSSRTRHNNQSSFVKLELAIEWRSSITEKLRAMSQVKGKWTMKDVLRNARILSGCQKIERIYGEERLEVRQLRRRQALQNWSIQLYKARDDRRMTRELHLFDGEVTL